MRGGEKSKVKKLFEIDKYKEFPRWYTEVLVKCDIVDARYPLKGMYVWKPYGYKVLRNTLEILRRLLEERGHEEVYFPMLIPESIFSKEKDFLEGFSGETFIVTGTPSKKLNEILYVRPTSETVIYYMWSIWIKGRKDLPIKIYQCVNVFRYETKATHPLLRVREIAAFLEAHTAHASKEECEKQIKEALEVYKEFFDELLLPYFIVLTPPWDTFSGAEYNYDFITAMPDGKALELGSVINLGQKFAKAFNIRFMDSDGKMKYVWQTCYGVSERVLGAVISIHGDNKGLIFPPKIAPIQVVIVPVARPEDKEIFDYCRKVAEYLRQKGVRTHVDEDLEHTPGWKYYYWDMKGVPTRIEIGPRELKTKSVTIARRDIREKVTVPLDQAVEKLREVWLKIEHNLKERALEHLKKMTKIVKEDFNEAVGSKGLIVVPWCGKESCADEIEATIGKGVLGEIVESPLTLPSKGKCICGSIVRKFALCGVTY